MDNKILKKFDELRHLNPNELNLDSIKQSNYYITLFNFEIK